MPEFYTRDDQCIPNAWVTRMRQLVGVTNAYAFRATVPAVRPVTDYTARVIPHHDAVAVPLEETHILWQRYYRG